MAKINIGKSDGNQVSIDLDILLRTRLLVQANSGGGKSWLLRRLAEQAFGKVQIIIIDPEGEFASLREQYDYVLVGKGGETPADFRSAALVATKLLELNASAVCDLYEMKVVDRHRWVRMFLEALIDAPKSLWHPVLVIIDESHSFCPEKGAGESEASDAMIGLATRGRKRGFCAVFATQRLAKLRKDAAAELTNVLIGQTFINVDRKRAAEALGIPHVDERAFFDEMKVIEPGHFWALGRAISKERILVEIGDIQTTHPEPGTSARVLEPPPAPSKIKALLPSLSDIPQEAERKAKTEQELRTEISLLKRSLAARPTVTVPEKVVERIETSVFKDGQLEQLEAFAHSLSDTGAQLTTLGRDLLSAMQTARKPLPLPQRVIRQISPPIGHTQLEPLEAGTITNPMQRILDAIAWLESLGGGDPRQVAVAFLAGYTYGGGAFNNPRGSLRTAGLVEYVGDRIRLTESGKLHAHFPDEVLTTEELQRRVMSNLPGPEQKILKVLIDAYPNDMTKEECAETAGYTSGGGAFNNPAGRLRSLGLINYPSPGRIVALPVLFLE